MELEFENVVEMGFILNPIPLIFTDDTDLKGKLLPRIDADERGLGKSETSPLMTLRLGRSGDPAIVRDRKSKPLPLINADDTDLKMQISTAD